MAWLLRKKAFVIIAAIAAIAAIVVVAIYWRPLVFLTAVLIYTAWHRLVS